MKYQHRLLSLRREFEIEALPEDLPTPEDEEQEMNRSWRRKVNWFSRLSIPVIIYYMTFHYEFPDEDHIYTPLREWHHRMYLKLLGVTEEEQLQLTQLSTDHYQEKNAADHDSTMKL